MSVDTPYGYWNMALEEVARTLQLDDPTVMTRTTALRRAVLAAEEEVHAYVTFADERSVTLWLLTTFRRVLRLRFAGNTMRYQSFLPSQITFLGGEIVGATSRMTEVAGLESVQFRFVINHEKPIELTLPVNIPHTVAGRDEIEFAQKLLAALFTPPSREG